MSDETTDRGVTPLVGNILLVAVAIIIGFVIIVFSMTFLEQTGAPTAEASFEYEPTAAGLEMTPVALGTDVIVKLNNERVARFDADETGKSKLIPTAPGDEIVVVSEDEDLQVLVEKEIDERSEIGDFIAYYTFDAGSGTTLFDRSGNGNDGTLKDDGGGSGPTWAGCGLRFDGNNDYVDINGISAPVDVTSFTIAVTYKQTGNDNTINQLIEHQFQASNNEWYLETDIGGTGNYVMDFAVEYPNAVIASSDTYSLGSKHVVVGTYNGKTDSYTLYVDGSQVASGSFDRPVNMGDMRMGRDFESSIQYLDGEICEARLYYSALSPLEVRTVTNAMA